MNYFWTADLHLDHANIIKYCGRTRFMSAKERKIYEIVKDKSQEEQKLFKISKESLIKMNLVLIRQWNERVKPEDVVFHIGDFCFKGGKEGGQTKAKYWEAQLNGRIIFIKGNHDKNNSCKTIIERLVIGYGGKRINLVHDPDFVDVRYKINFVGHIHNKWKIKRIRQGEDFTDAINIGTDVWNFMPVSFNETMKRYSQWRKQNAIN